MHFFCMADWVLWKQTLNTNFGGKMFTRDQPLRKDRGESKPRQRGASEALAKPVAALKRILPFRVVLVTG